MALPADNCHQRAQSARSESIRIPSRQSTFPREPSCGHSLLVCSSSSPYSALNVHSTDKCGDVYQGTEFCILSHRSADNGMQSAAKKFKSLRLILFFAALFVCCDRGTIAQTSAESSQTNNSSVAAARVDTAPSVDGTLTNEAWNSAATVSDFRQREPFEKQAATEKTEVRILYDKKYLYFGIQCHDSEPKRIQATELRRDADYSVDDYFTILISPNNDKRNGYTFTVNPLGTQFDALITDEGRVNDPNWDGIWKSDAHIDSDGWTATVAIPFSTLNFKTSDNVTIGINFARFIRRKNEEDLWRSYLRIYGITRISESGELTDLRDIGSGRLLIIKPYVLGGVRSDPTNGTEALHTGGLDIKYGIRSNVVANLTFNTDFADAEVDAVRLNLTPFKSSLPEKRQFFLENSGIFDFSFRDTQLFFSRQIGIDPVTGEQVPLDAGAKVTGSLGRYDFGILDVKTRAKGPNPYANYFVILMMRHALR